MDVIEQIFSNCVKPDSDTGRLETDTTLVVGEIPLNAEEAVQNAVDRVVNNYYKAKAEGEICEYRLEVKGLIMPKPLEKLIISIETMAQKNIGDFLEPFGLGGCLERISIGFLKNCIEIDNEDLKIHLGNIRKEIQERENGGLEA